MPYYSAEKDQLETEEFNKLGTPASLGCVRLQIEDCKWIYDECPSGSPVVIYDGDVVVGGGIILGAVPDSST